MKRMIFLPIALTIALTGQVPSPSPAVQRHLEYRFGYNTAVADQGNGTGSMSVDISGPAADGGVTISATDTWWNAVRPAETNACEVYADGDVSCQQRPYRLSAMQLVLFPLLAQAYFHGLSPDGTSRWTQKYRVSRGDLSTWDCTLTLQGKGPIPNAGRLVMIQSNGTIEQQGGHYRAATVQETIAYDPVAGVPAIVRDVRSHLPQRSPANQDLVELKLTSDSAQH